MNLDPSHAPTIVIKLMPDYQCWPLWWHQGTGKVGNIDPASLGLQPDTIARLDRWAREHDSFINMDDPAQPVELPPGTEASFEEEGKALHRLLKQELAGRYKVVYFSIKEGRLLA